MCRLMFYVGEPVLLDHLLIRPTNSLINQFAHCRSDETPVNGDGFGVAWYAPEITPEPGLFKSLTPALTKKSRPVPRRTGRRRIGPQPSRVCLRSDFVQPALSKSTAVASSG